MTKAELAARIASEGGIIKSQAEKALGRFGFSYLRRIIKR
jgi:nucleoid DNA-binding protein